MAKRRYRKHRTTKRQWPTEPAARKLFRKSINKENNDRQYRELRDAIFDAYGRKCVCCHETEPAFLCIDHISGGGRQERISAGLGVRLWRLLQKKGFPSGYQTLCANCNQARRGGRDCPHQLAGTQRVPDKAGRLARESAKLDALEERAFAEGLVEYQ